MKLSAKRTNEMREMMLALTDQEGRVGMNESPSSGSGSIYLRNFLAQVLHGDKHCSILFSDRRAHLHIGFSFFLYATSHYRNWGTYKFIHFEFTWNTDILGIRNKPPECNSIHSYRPYESKYIPHYSNIDGELEICQEITNSPREQ